MLKKYWRSYCPWLFWEQWVKGYQGHVTHGLTNLLEMPAFWSAKHNPRASGALPHLASWAPGDAEMGQGLWTRSTGRVLDTILPFSHTEDWNSQATAGLGLRSVAAPPTFLPKELSLETQSHLTIVKVFLLLSLSPQGWPHDYLKLGAWLGLQPAFMSFPFGEGSYLFVDKPNWSQLPRKISDCLPSMNRYLGIFPFMLVYMQMNLHIHISSTSAHLILIKTYIWCILELHGTWVLGKIACVWGNVSTLSGKGRPGQSHLQCQETTCAWPKPRFLLASLQTCWTGWMTAFIQRTFLVVCIFNL